jgi:N,N'-diacetyllegionaminate synthase
MTKIIAELCQNHNGDIKILEEMVHAASESGADYAKIQSLHSSELTHRKRFDEGLIEGGKIKTIKRDYKSEYERLKKLDLEESDHVKFINFCKKYNIKPLTTIFSLGKVDMVDKLFDEVKISSFDCASHRLIEEISKKDFDHIIVSTGATFNREIKKTCNILNLANKKFTLLHCVSIYPTPMESANIERINFLKKFNDKVGISDHSNPEINKNLIPAVAFYLGVDCIEKHFTILDKDKTKDGPVSANPNQLKEIVNLSKSNKEDIKKYIDENINDYKILLGSENRDMTDIELLNRDYYQGRFASKDSNNDKYVFNWQEK